MIELKSIYKQYRVKGFFSKGSIYAIKNINLMVEDGKHIGIIGESGAGKTTVGKIIGLIDIPTSGSVLFDKTIVKKDNIKKFRKQIGAVFQDPSTSLDPRYKVVSTLKEANKNIEKIHEVCAEVNIKKELLNKYPAQLSGGEQQRVAIARALLMQPKYILLDESTSALDISTQAKIINLLCNINKNKQYTYIFISHDLKLANFISDKIYVLYDGEIVEEYDKLKDEPLHPYTVSLLKEAKKVSQDKAQGCFFYDMCDKRMDKCKKETPILNAVSHTHKVKCFLYD